MISAFQGGWLWFAASASAEDLAVGEDRSYQSLEEALAVAEAGDRLVVDAGIYSPVFVDVDVEIVASAPGSVVISSLPGAPAIDVAPGTSLVLRGVVLDGLGLERVLYVAAGSEVSVEDSELQGGSAADWGGCVYSDASSLSFLRTSITGCTAEAGGGIYAEDGALSLSAVAVRSCTATSGFGGGIGVQRTVLQGRGLEVTDNLADDPIGLEHEKALGGGLFVGEYSSLDLLGCTFSGNEARSVGAIAGRGGAVRLWLTDAIIEQCDLSDNVATEYGSAIAAASSSVELSASLLGGNLVDEPLPAEATYGGALFCDELSSCVVDRSWFEGNDAGDGGAIASIGALEVTTSMFCANTAQSDGGALDVGNADPSIPVRLAGNVFALNTAVGEGGAIVATDGDQRLLNNHIVGNEAPSAAAVAVTTIGVVEGLEMSGNLVAWSLGQTLPALEIDRVPYVERYSWWHDNTPYSADFTPGEGSGEGDPLLSGPAASCDPADLLPGPQSPLRDAGDPEPSRQDPDGSRNDIGGFGGPESAEAALFDLDGDSIVAMLDCDDTDPAVYRGAEELCNGIDDDCDGLVDDEDAAADALWLYPDLDGDGAGATGVAELRCGAPGWSESNTDCDDSDPNVASPSVWYNDQDSDGIGGVPLDEPSCQPPEGAVASGGDCDDLDPARAADCSTEPPEPQDTEDPLPQETSGATSAKAPPSPAFGFGCDAAGAARPLSWALLPLSIAALRRQRPQR